MSNPFVGEIRMFGGNFAPQGWEFCWGQLISISENETLYVLIGTTYGGDGVTTFALPDLRSRFPMHQGQSTVLGQIGGESSVTLSAAQLPAHSHAPVATSSAASTANPQDGTWAAWPDSAYSAAAPTATMAAGALGVAGSSHPHDNMPPFLGMSFIISMFGVFPSQS